jgi:hypothetical protein
MKIFEHYAELRREHTEYQDTVQRLSAEFVTPCFDDWKRFCAVLREIASGRPLSGVEAQKRAQAVLDECGYTWPRAPIAAAAKPHSDAAPSGRFGTAITRSCELTTDAPRGGVSD